MSLVELTSVLYDYLYLQGSIALDCASTYVGVTKHGLNNEKNLIARTGIAKKGSAKYLSRTLIDSLIIGMGAVGASYGLDKICRIEDNYLNFHHVLAYGSGTFRYLVGVHNLAVAFNRDRIADILFLAIRPALVPTRVFAKLYHTITGQKIWDE